MPLVIPDELLRHANLTEEAARIEIACRLFDAELISKGMASRFAGLSRLDFEEQLVRRGLPVIRYTQEMLDEDLRSLERFRGREGVRVPGGE
jgi:predicted HTH domain antitoxin